MDRKGIRFGIEKVSKRNFLVFRHRELDIRDRIRITGGCRIPNFPSQMPIRSPCFRKARRYRDLVKKITVSLPDELYSKARVKAAERNTSLSAMIKQFLESLAEEEGEFKRLEHLQEESYAQIERFQASNRLTREKLYRRGNLR